MITQLPADATVLGFDVGSRRIGVAVTNLITATPRAIGVVDVYEQGADWTSIQRLFRDWRPHACIVGDPLTIEGGDQPIRQFAHAFAADMQDKFQVPVWLVDERRTSIEAARRFAIARAEGRRRKRDGDVIDADAAMIILERWLLAPEDAYQMTSNVHETD